MEKLSVFIFIARGGTLYTPDLTSALEGVTRDTIVVLASEFGIPLIEKRITRDEVYVADEAFFTGYNQILSLWTRKGEGANATGTNIDVARDAQIEDAEVGDIVGVKQSGHLDKS